MSPFSTYGALAALVVAVMLAATATPCDANMAIKTNVTQFYIYAQGADEWVRTHTAYALAPMRAADGISKSQATRYVLEDGSHDQYIHFHPATWATSGFNLRAVGVAHPYCAPASPGGKWDYNTLFCNSDGSGMNWLRIIALGPTDPLSTGITVKLQDIRTGLFCNSLPWPNNEAALACNGGGAQVNQLFNLES